MNANYSEAIEKQIALLRSMRTDLGYGFGDPLRDEVGFRIRTTLVEAEPFYVSRDIGNAVGIAAQGLPATPLSDGVLPSPAGFVWFEQPVPLPATPLMDALAPEDASSKTKGLRAISWQRGFPLRGGGDIDGVTVIYWNWVPSRTLPWPSRLQHWAFGSRWSEFKHTKNPTGIDDTDLHAEAWGRMAAERRCFHALLLFMDQRILTAPAYSVDRHVRKRVERDGWSHQPIVRVIQLRRRERIDDGRRVEPVEREWSCQWVVRGHWRQQPYPKVGAVRPKWITPYVKGPDDKPLKPPRATVFAVVR